MSGSHQGRFSMNKRRWSKGHGLATRTSGRLRRMQHLCIGPPIVSLTYSALHSMSVYIPPTPDILSNRVIRRSTVVLLRATPVTPLNKHAMMIFPDPSAQYILHVDLLSLEARRVRVRVSTLEEKRGCGEGSRRRVDLTTRCR